jgi:hypothetical protein
MPYQKVRLLNARRVPTRRTEADISHVFDTPAGTPGKANGNCANSAGGFYGTNNIAGITTGTDAYNYIAWLCQCHNLSLEDVLIPKVV